MNVEEKFVLLADLFEVNVSELTPETELESIDSWDSMTALSLIILLEDEFNIAGADGHMIKSFITIQDVLNVTEDSNV